MNICRFKLFKFTWGIHCNDLTCYCSGEGAENAFCGGVISLDNWDMELSIPVMATTDLVFDGDVIKELDVEISTICEETVTYNYTYSSVKVINTCFSKLKNFSSGTILWEVHTCLLNLSPSWKAMNKEKTM